MIIQIKTGWRSGDMKFYHVVINAILEKPKLENLTKEELIKLCIKKGIKVDRRKKRETIINDLREYKMDPDYIGLITSILASCATGMLFNLAVTI